MTRSNPSKMDVCRTSSTRFPNLYYFLLAYDPKGLTTKVLDGFTDILLNVPVDFTRYCNTSCCNISQLQKKHEAKGSVSIEHQTLFVFTVTFWYLYQKLSLFFKIQNIKTY